MRKTYSIQTWNEIIDYRRTYGAALKLAQAYSMKHGTTVWVFKAGAEHHLAVVLATDATRELVTDHQITAEWAHARLIKEQYIMETET